MPFILLPENKNTIPQKTRFHWGKFNSGWMMVDVKSNDGVQNVDKQLVDGLDAVAQ